MTEGKKGMSAERREYLKRYRKEKLKRIPLDVNLELWGQLKACADAKGYPVNKLLKIIILDYIAHMEF